MKKKLMLAGLALALGAGYTLTAFSQVKPEILVKQRQAAMTLQGKYYGPMAGMAQGKIPYNGVQSAVGALVAATKTGNETGVRAAITEVGKAGCGNCHQNFRQKD